MGRQGRFGRWMAAGLAVVSAGLTGCSGFFPPIVNTGGTTGSSTGNSVFVANATTSSIGALSIIAAVAAVPATATTPAVPATAAALTVQSNSPIAAGFAPLSMAVTPANTFLYVGGVNGIYLYLIGSNGTLSAPSTGTNQAVAYAASLTVSPDGQWLIALDGTNPQLDIFQINSSTGALTSVGAGQPPVFSITSGTYQPSSVRMSPNGALIFAALGTGGDVVLTFNTTTGAAVSSQYLPTGTTTTSDFGLVVDPNSAYLYVARSGTNGGVAVFSIGSGGTLTPVAGSPFKAGNGTYSVALDSTGTYLYAANRTDATISGFTITPATATTPPTLTPLSSSPYATGTGVQSIAIDRTGKYLLAAAPGGNPDLTMYSFDTTVAGQLDPATTAATGTPPAGSNAAGAAALALTR